jgi:hypothetical protein
MKILLAFLILVNVTHADEVRFKSARSLRAQQKYASHQAKAQSELEKKIHAAYEEYDKTLKPVRATYLETLEKEKENATKEGDLEEALKVKSEIELIQKAVSEAEVIAAATPEMRTPRKLLEQKLVGTVWKIDHPSLFQFFANGKATSLEKGGDWHWAAISGNRVVIWYPAQNWINMFEFDDKVEKCQMHTVGGTEKITSKGRIVNQQ